MLITNKHLRELSMKGCNLGSAAMDALGEGLSTNISLKVLDLSNNKITSVSGKWSEVLSKCGLKSLDLSNNQIGERGVMALVKGIEKKEIDEDERKCKLKILGLRFVGMTDSGARALSQMMNSNYKISKLSMEGNAIYQRFIEEIQVLCQRNKNLEKKTTVPKYR